MGELINGKTPGVIKNGIRNMLKSCADISGVKDGVCHEICCSYEDDNCCHETILMDALALIEHLESERDAALAKVPKWISVKEQPPKENTYYMVSVNLYGNRGMYTDIAMFDGELWVRDAGSYFDILDKGDVTHFMPLPEPPKEDNHENA